MAELVLKNGVKAPFSLKQSGQYDMETGAKSKITGWGAICKERHEKKKSGRKG
jgi:hypothetical protein